MEDFSKIIENYDFEGELVGYKLFGSGHINSTFLVEYNVNSKKVLYIIQRVNTIVFKDIDSLMKNIFAVTSYLRGVIEQNGGDPDRETLNFVRTSDGRDYYKADDGACYRAYRFVDDSKSYDSVSSPELFGKSGVAFGRFQKYLKDFPADTLNETIPNFHNTIWRYENEFLPALENNVSGRAESCADEIAFIKDRENELSRLVDLINEGKLPLRVTHNDTKLNNVIFDKDTDEAICVIDLDTVMPGLALYDFGDSIRFGANKCSEDDPDASKAGIDLEYFRAYAQGFLSEAGSSLNQCELDNLAFSAKLMTLECGMRFLTDYINGDVYFKTSYPEHNLVRARTQLALVHDMEKHFDEMQKIIAEI